MCNRYIHRCLVITGFATSFTYCFFLFSLWPICMSSHMQQIKWSIFSDWIDRFRVIILYSRQITLMLQKKNYEIRSGKITWWFARRHIRFIYESCLDAEFNWYALVWSACIKYFDKYIFQLVTMTIFFLFHVARWHSDKPSFLAILIWLNLTQNL